MNENETTPHYNRVKQFMSLARQNCPDQPIEMDEETRKLRATLLLEEVLETLQEGLGVSSMTISMEDGKPKISVEMSDHYDPVQLLDGCCDVKVIVTGTLIAAGLTDAEPQRLVDCNNLDKFRPGYSIREDGKLIKPPDHTPPDLEAEVVRQSKL